MTTVFNQLMRWQSTAPLHDSSKTRLICHQPARAALAYLHVLYPGLGDAEIVLTADLLHRDLPPKLDSFYRETNGVRWFEGSVFIGGLVGILSRDPTYRQPISLDLINQSFAALHPQWYAQDYFVLGGISINRQDRLICGGDDHIVLLNADSGEVQREFLDVYDCLSRLSVEMTDYWNKAGDFLGDWDLLDTMITKRSGSA